jgi:hypothetical protein
VLELDRVAEVQRPPGLADIHVLPLDGPAPGVPRLPEGPYPVRLPHPSGAAQRTARLRLQGVRDNPGRTHRLRRPRAGTQQSRGNVRRAVAGQPQQLDGLPVVVVPVSRPPADGDTTGITCRYGGNAEPRETSRQRRVMPVQVGYIAVCHRNRDRHNGDLELAVHRGHHVPLGSFVVLCPAKRQGCRHLAGTWHDHRAGFGLRPELGFCAKWAGCEGPPAPHSNQPEVPVNTRRAFERHGALRVSRPGTGPLTQKAPGLV